MVVVWQQVFFMHFTYVNVPHLRLLESQYVRTEMYILVSFVSDNVVQVGCEDNLF